MRAIVAVSGEQIVKVTDAGPLGVAHQYSPVKHFVEPLA